jgi:hypothetical protein
MLASEGMFLLEAPKKWHPAITAANIEALAGITLTEEETAKWQ